jgi:hypothetical protein
MAARTLVQRTGVGLWLVATMIAGTARAQNLFVGPGAVVIRQYRPGAAIYSPSTYTYIGLTPFIYGPLGGTRRQVYFPPRIQLPIPMDTGIGTMPRSPCREYYSPHIPRYYRHQDPPEQMAPPAAPTPQSSVGEGPTSKEKAPAPGEPKRVEQGNAAESPPAQTGQITPPPGDRIRSRESLPGERTRKPTRRKPVRYR